MFDLPEDIDLRKIVCSTEQIRFALGLSRNRYAEQAQSFVVTATGEEKYILPADVELDEVTVTQKQFAVAVGLSRARINQLVSQGVLKKAQGSRRGRLMFLASMENFYEGQKEE